MPSDLFELCNFCYILVLLEPNLKTVSHNVCVCVCVHLRVVCGDHVGLSLKVHNYING